MEYPWETSLAVINKRVDIHGSQQGFQCTNEESGLQASQEIPPLTKEHLELLHKFLQSQLQTSLHLSTPTYSFSKTGNVPPYVFVSTDSTDIVLG